MRPPRSQSPERTILRSALQRFLLDPPPCSAASFEVNSEPHTGARPSVRLCVGLKKMAKCREVLGVGGGPAPPSKSQLLRVQPGSQLYRLRFKEFGSLFTAVLQLAPLRHFLGTTMRRSIHCTGL